jgi:hypothetical protein
MSPGLFRRRFEKGAEARRAATTATRRGPAAGDHHARPAHRATRRRENSRPGRGEGKRAQGLSKTPPSPSSRPPGWSACAQGQGPHQGPHMRPTRSASCFVPTMDASVVLTCCTYQPSVASSSRETRPGISARVNPSNEPPILFDEVMPKSRRNGPPLHNTSLLARWSDQATVVSCRHSTMARFIDGAGATKIGNAASPMPPQHNGRRSKHPSHIMLVTPTWTIKP